MKKRRFRRALMVLCFLFPAWTVHGEDIRLGEVYAFPDGKVSIVLEKPRLPDKSKLSLTEEGKITVYEPDDMSQFGKSSDWSLALAVCVDTSGTMVKSRGDRDDPLGEVKKALKQLVQLESTIEGGFPLKASDRVALLSFEDQVVTRSWLEKDKTALKEHIEALKFDREEPNETRLFDGVYEALSKLSNVKSVEGSLVDRRVLVISDGYDENSGKTKEQVIDKANELGIPIDFIARIKDENYEKMRDEGTIGRMDFIADATGGTFVRARQGEVWDVLETLVDNLQKRSVIIFKRSVGDGTTESAALQWNPPEGAVLSRPLAVRIPATAVDVPPPVGEVPWKWVVAVTVLAIFTILLEWARMKRKKRLELKATYSSKGIKRDPSAVSRFLKPRARAAVTALGHKPSASGPTQVDDQLPEHRRFTQPGASPPVAFLLGRDGSMEGKQVAVDKPEFSIGADPANDLVIRNDDYVSAHHASLRYEQKTGAMYLTDANSTNGTSLNDNRLKAAEPTLVRPGDRIQVGRTSFEIRRTTDLRDARGAEGRAGTPRRTSVSG